MPHAMRPIRAAAWMLGAQMLFAFMVSSARVGGRDLPWQEVCAARFVVGAFTAYGAARVRGKSLRITNMGAAWWRSAFGTISALGTFYLYATPQLPVGDAATLLATSPLFVAFLAVPLLGEPIRRSVALSMILGLLGIALVAHPTFTTARHLVAIGTGTALVSGLAFIWLRRMGPNESSEAVVVHFLTVGSVAMVLLCAPVWRTPTPAEAVVLSATGLFGGLAQIAMTRAYALDSAARVSVLGYAGVVFTRALAVPFFGEVPSAMQAAGSLLVVVAGAVLATGRRPPASDAEPRARTGS
jgi:drug/metabolite transporter (DMT)-like permease